MPHEEAALALGRRKGSGRRSHADLKKLLDNKMGDEHKIRDHNNKMRRRFGREPDFTVFYRRGFYAGPPMVRAQFYYFDDWYFDKYSVNYYYTRFANDQEKPDQELHCSFALDNFEQVIKAYNEVVQRKFKRENK